MILFNIFLVGLFCTTLTDVFPIYIFNQSVFSEITTYNFANLAFVVMFGTMKQSLSKATISFLNLFRRSTMIAYIQLKTLSKTSGDE